MIFNYIFNYIGSPGGPGRRSPKMVRVGLGGGSAREPTWGHPLWNPAAPARNAGFHSQCFIWMLWIWVLDLEGFQNSFLDLT